MSKTTGHATKGNVTNIGAVKFITLTLLNQGSYKAAYKFLLKKYNSVSDKTAEELEPLLDEVTLIAESPKDIAEERTKDLIASLKKSR